VGTVLIQVISSTTREGRFSERTAHWVVAALSAREDFDVELIDLRDYPLPFFDAVPPARAPREYATEEVARLGRTLDRADGFIVLTAEYNHGYPAVLKNAMDWTFPEWHRKPVAFVGWGNVGGARAIEQLRLVAVEFEMAPLRHAVHILPDVMIPARQAGDVSDTTAFARLEPKLKLLADDLTWWAAALAAARRREQR
jgi:NAD(P)H-dependent FMN reductase